MRYFGMGLLTLLSFSLTSHATEVPQHEVGIFDNILPQSQYNNYKLLLTVGLDDALDQNPVVFGSQGFTDIFGWNQSQIDAFRNAAIQWNLERFGLDFTQGYYDAASGTVSTEFGTLAPLSFISEYRVLSSNNFNILPTTPITPSKIQLAEYVVFFNGTPVNWGGTYAGAAPFAVSPTDTTSFTAYKISLNNSGTRNELIFMRTYYPTEAAPFASTPLPFRLQQRSQLYSPKYGAGFMVMSSAIPLEANADGKFPSYVRASWSFPGSFEIPDWNGYTTAPIAL